MRTLERLGYRVVPAADLEALHAAVASGVDLALVHPGMVGPADDPEARMRADAALQGCPLLLLADADVASLASANVEPGGVRLVTRIELQLAGSRQVAFLQELNRRLLAPEDLDATLGAVLEAVAAEVPVDTATFLLGDDHGVFRVRATRGYRLRDAELRAFAPGEGVVGWVVEHKSPAIVGDSDIDPRFAPRHDGVVPRSMLVVPVIIADQVLGAISLVRRAPSRPFDDADIVPVATIANGAAIALENVRLHEHERSLKEKLEELERLYGREREIVDRLDEYDRLYTQAVATVSHELKTPLMGIRGFAKMIADGDVEGEEARDFAREIHDNAVRLSRYVERILEDDEVRQGGTTLRLQPVALRPLVEEVLRSLQNLGGSRHLVVDEVGDDVPLVHGDPDRLTRILVNLVSNAIKYSPSGGVVRIGAAGHAEGVQLWVEDEGVGVPPEARQRIFDRFYRVSHPQTAAVEGSGLGLAIVRGLVELHGGRVWVETPAGGRGSRFCVVLPRATPSGAPALSVVPGREGVAGRRTSS